jgi:hypothetical protein
VVAIDPANRTVTLSLVNGYSFGKPLLYISTETSDPTASAIEGDVNGEDATGPLQIASTFDAADSVAWRQWHHWNLAPQLFKIRLSKGKNVLSVHILTNGNMNLAYFDFKQIPE